MSSNDRNDRGYWRAFEGANGWYVAYENEDGFHHQPFSADLSEDDARASAARLNNEPET
jgi:hypothetical protein